jgi:hypothetical protein
MPLPYLRSLELVSRLELSMPEVRQFRRQARYILPMRAMRQLGWETRLRLPVRRVREAGLGSLANACAYRLPGKRDAGPGRATPLENQDLEHSAREFFCFIRKPWLNVRTQDVRSICD